MSKFLAACIQTNAAPDIAINIERITPMVERAANKGAKLITLPECVSTRNRNSTRRAFQHGSDRAGPKEDRCRRAAMLDPAFDTGAARQAP